MVAEPKGRDSRWRVRSHRVYGEGHQDTIHWHMANQSGHARSLTTFPTSARLESFRQCRNSLVRNEIRVEKHLKIHHFRNTFRFNFTRNTT